MEKMLYVLKMYLNVGWRDGWSSNYMFLQFVFCEYNETGISLSLNRSSANFN